MENKKEIYLWDLSEAEKSKLYTRVEAFKFLKKNIKFEDKSIEFSGKRLSANGFTFIGANGSPIMIIIEESPKPGISEVWIGKPDSSSTSFEKIYYKEDFDDYKRAYGFSAEVYYYELMVKAKTGIKYKEEPEEQIQPIEENGKPAVAAILVDINADYRNQYLLNQAIEQFLGRPQNEFSDEEKTFLSRYAGSGGLAKYGAEGPGLLWEYYTPDVAVKKMWGLAFKYGYTGGKILEPSVGIGRFVAYAPEKKEVTSYEINPYSFRIAKILYPEITIYNSPFESHFFNGNSYNDNYERGFSLVIGNPPYGEFTGKYAGMGEKRRTHASQYDHYFIYRGLQVLNPGGLLVFIVPSSFLKNDSEIKEKIGELGDLVDAYRLPNGIFPTTEIGTDIIVLKKL